MYGEKSAIIRRNKAYIIKQRSRADADRPTMQQLADELGVGAAFLDHFMRQWRKAGDAPGRALCVLDADQELVTELHRSGLNPRQIGEKWGVSRTCVREALVRWGVIR